MRLYRYGRYRCAVTLFVGVLAATGCGADGAVSDGGTQLDARINNCPATAPVAGTACGDLPETCYYYWECNGDQTGTIADCRSGNWVVGHDAILQLCPSQPVHDGDSCACPVESPCSWSCQDGGTATATCEIATAKWRLTGPTTCTTEIGDGG
jgi:hypothetical protein